MSEEQTQTCISLDESQLREIRDKIDEVSDILMNVSYALKNVEREDYLRALDDIRKYVNVNVIGKKIVLESYCHKIAIIDVDSNKIEFADKSEWIHLCHALLDDAIMSIKSIIEYIEELRERIDP